MLQYLIILLDDTSVSFCHYKNSKAERRLIPLGTLREGIRFGMMENLMIQFVYPDYELPQEYRDLVGTIDHSKIKPSKDGADIWVTNLLECDEAVEIPVVWRTDKETLFSHEAEVVKMLSKAPRLNIALTDVETFTEAEFATYKSFLDRLLPQIEQMYVNEKAPQLNIITDRMMLAEMNNCGAGDSCITLAPNGKFYICPAFYYDNECDDIGSLENGLNIKNNQLYKLEYAPICRRCDAYQCKRCIWLNRKTTLEVNTPSHEQCVAAHIERNASRQLLYKIREIGEFLPDKVIEEIDYLDPFDKREEW